jgi:hypothetical protein
MCAVSASSSYIPMVGVLADSFYAIAAVKVDEAIRQRDRLLDATKAAKTLFESLKVNTTSSGSSTRKQSELRDPVQEAQAFLVLPFIMPTMEKTTGWNGRLLLGRSRILWSATESRYLLTSQDGLLSCSGRLVVRASLLARETTVRS